MPNLVDNVAINLLNINLDDTEDNCMICQEVLSSATKYKLPECGHEYHTHCVVAWFRNGDSRCPYCGNKGVNHSKKEKNLRRSRARFDYVNEFKITELRKYSKTCGANKLLKKYFMELETLTKRLSVKLDEQKKFNERIKTSLTIFKETEKQRRECRMNIYKARTAIFEKKMSIIDMHIVPLIIPTPVDVNF